MHQQPVGGLLAGGGAGTLEDEPLGRRQALFLREPGDGALERLAVELARVQRERGAGLSDRRELVGVDIDRDHGRAGCVRDLHAVPADPAHAHHRRQAAGRDAGAHYRLVRRCERVGDHRDVGEREAGFREARLVDLAQPAARHDDVGCESTVDVVAGHLLVAADVRAAALAGPALAAGNHRRDEDGLPDPALGAGAGRTHPPAHLVPERERQCMVGAHAVVIVAEISVADAAAGDFDHHLARLRRRLERLAHHRRPGRRHQPPVCRCGHRASSSVIRQGRSAPSGPVLPPGLTPEQR
ncbi:MAG: hypothetical protein M5U08_17860 [Burkholderiales bacterium]|nr:hypothetical protein [Burkholderiales bacterium]